MTDRPTRFELLTAAAFAWFADVAVDAAVIEVGLGGTWDCHQRGRRPRSASSPTSATTTPTCSGPTLEGIALDKAGIVKSGSIAVVGETDPGLVSIIETRAPRGRGRGGVGGRTRLRLHGQPARGGGPAGRPPDPRRLLRRGAGVDERPAPGRQRGRARWRRPRRSSAGRSTRRWSRRASARSRWPVASRSSGASPLTLIDGAHNVAGMEALAAAVTEGFSVDGPTGRGRRHAAGPRPLGDARRRWLRSGSPRLYACAPDSPARHRRRGRRRGRAGARARRRGGRDGRRGRRGGPAPGARRRDASGRRARSTS